MYDMYILVVSNECGAGECGAGFSRVDAAVVNKAFRKHYAVLLETIDNPTILAARLYSDDVLSRHTRDKINELTLTEQKVTELLVATEKTIRLDPSNYHKFVEALEKESSMQHLCGKLRSTMW